MAQRLLGVLGLVLALVLGGCTYSRQEPGLFRTRSPTSTPLPPAPPAPPTASVNPELPVAGETVWTSGEGVGLTARFAVHAVRRIPGATVLDYSVTPLTAPGLREGDPLPGRVDLGLTRYVGNTVAIWLLDPTHDRVYTSLAHESRRELNHCLCTPLWADQSTFRIGQTSLLQSTFPTLPRGLRRVDVLLANQTPVAGVPVTPVGQVPTARAGTETDLTRPAAAASPGPLRTLPVSGLGPQSRVQIGLDAVLAGPGVTALRWRIRAPSGLDYRLYVLGPPVSAPLPEAVAVPALNSTDGPTLQLAGRRTTLAATWLTRQLNGRPGYECACSELDLWARSLSQPGGTISVTTLFPGLPTGTRTVRVQVRGLAPVSLPVTDLPDAGRRLGAPVAAAGPRWVYASDAPPPARTVDEWPTPLPDEWQLPDYRGSTERVGPLPHA
ncbi:hypothetical protein [uncultured Friedmanniella sp.]|uniref:hypothetical protein n=1 Tax=uncultured Friedmanniella sp. TaxID=335381 RepID=UPI0035C95506